MHTIKLILLAVAVTFFSSSAFAVDILGQGFSCADSTILKGKNQVFSLKAAKASIQKKIKKLGTSKKDKAKKKTLNALKKSFDNCVNGKFSVTRQFEIFSAVYPAKYGNRIHTMVAVFAVIRPDEFPGAEEVCVIEDRSSNPTFFGGSPSNIVVNFQNRPRPLCELLYQQENFTDAELLAICPVQYHDKRVVLTGPATRTSDQPACLISPSSVCGVPDITSYFSNGISGFRYGVISKPANTACPGI